MSTTTRKLPPLPGHGTTLGDLRQWLTTALGPPPGYILQDFTRAGRQKTDPCELVLEAPGGGRVAYRFNEQRELSTPSSLRAAIAAVTDSLCRVPALTRSEQEDIWIGLCALAEVLVQQDDRDEMRDWLEGFLRTAAHINGLTFEPEGQFDALLALQRRRLFTRAAALALSDPNIAPEQKTRPVVVHDGKTSRLWVRAGELATYLRHVVGTGPMPQSALDGRMAEVGADRMYFEKRIEEKHPHAVLYQLPEGIERRLTETEDDDK